MTGFVLATLIPVPLLLLAALSGGAWGWGVLFYLTGFTAFLDAALPRARANRDSTFAAGSGLTVALGLLHLVLIAAALRFVAGPGGVEGWDILPVAAAYGIWFGQGSHPNAHELIHRSGRNLRRLGRVVYISLLFGHHASAHPKVHHVHVASRNDPNTARLGEGFWRYAPRAWIGSFAEGLRAETRDLDRSGQGPLAHPYIGYILCAAGVLVLAYGFGGWAGVAIYTAICALAQVQILLSDYVQHYGLERASRPDGRPVPVGPQHSWNTPHAMTSAMMLNAPRHSDHHLHPARIFPGLQLDPATMPMLPRSLPVMATVALFPRWWRHVMDPRVRDWRARGAPAAPAQPRTAERETVPPLGAVRS